MGEIHSDKLLVPCRVLWARAKANPLPGPQEQQMNLIMKNRRGSHTRQIWTPSCPLGRVHYPSEAQRIPEPHSFAYKATFWDGEGILQHSRTVLISRNVILSMPKLLGALIPAPTTEQWAWNIQVYQTDPAFPTQTHFPAHGLNQHQPQTAPFSHYPATRKMSDSNACSKWTISAGEWIQASPISYQCKTTCSISVWVTFCLVGFNQTNLSNPRFVGTAGGGSSRNSNSQSSLGEKDKGEIKKQP